MYSPSHLKNVLPLSASLKDRIYSFRKKAKDIVKGSSSLIPLIIGPCSIHDCKGAFLYAKALKEINEHIKDTFFLVMRVYIEKPRTTVGWKGLVYDPFLTGEEEMKKGIYLARELCIDLTKLGVPIAMEFVNPILAPYFEDLVTWGFVGARTASSQIHRELTSSFSFPVGFKNTVDGNLDLPIGGVISSRSAHHFLTIDEEGSTTIIHSNGNPLTHLVLRGSLEGPNYDQESIQSAFRLQQKYGVSTKVLIDCAHDNSNKNHITQEEVFQDVICQIANDRAHILGLMVESYLEEGNQMVQKEVKPLTQISITDPCIGLEKTLKLINWSKTHLQTGTKSVISI